MATQTFRDLIVWQHAGNFAVDIYNEFREVKDYSFKDQIQRATVSIMNNIAEGYGRKSDKLFRQFLYIAKGSAAEVESMLILAERLHYTSKESSLRLIEQVQVIQRLLTAFVRTLPSKDLVLGTKD